MVSSSWRAAVVAASGSPLDHGARERRGPRQLQSRCRDQAPGRHLGVCALGHLLDRAHHRRLTARRRVGRDAGIAGAARPEDERDGREQGGEGDETQATIHGGGSVAMAPRRPGPGPAPSRPARGAASCVRQRATRSAVAGDGVGCRAMAGLPSSPLGSAPASPPPDSGALRRGRSLLAAPRRRRWAAIALLVAIVLSGGALRFHAASRTRATLSADEQAYTHIADALRLDHRFGAPHESDPFRWAPLTPVLFAAAAIVARTHTVGDGHGLGPARVAQALVSTLTILAAWGLALVLAGWAAGLLAAAGDRLLPAGHPRRRVAAVRAARCAAAAVRAARSRACRASRRPAGGRRSRRAGPPSHRRRLRWRRRGPRAQLPRPRRHAGRRARAAARRAVRPPAHRDGGPPRRGPA